MRAALSTSLTVLGLAGLLGSAACLSPGGLPGPEDGGIDAPDSAPDADAGVCVPNHGPGCCYPTCGLGQTLSCIGANVCGYPCTCLDFTDGGAADLSGPGSSCASDSDCSSGGICGFPVADACAAHGGCFPAPGALCKAYSPGCACDGTIVNLVCNGLPAGYVARPLLHSGACVGSDAGVSPDLAIACPGSFPTFDRGCAVDTDCAIAVHQTNCCGSTLALGIAASQVPSFDAAEKICDGEYPRCGCPALAAVAEDGNMASAGRPIVAACAAGACHTSVPASVCHDNGGSCTSNSDCCSNNCILRMSPGYCCQPGGCP